MQPKISFSTMSVTGYIMSALDQHPGWTGHDLKKNRPDHIAGQSIAPRLLELTTLKVLRRSPVSNPSGGNRATFAYWIADKDLLPKGWQATPFRDVTQGIKPKRKPVDPPPSEAEEPMAPDRQEERNPDPRIVIYLDGRKVALAIPTARALYGQLGLVFG